MQSYYGWNTDAAALAQSASGGVFSILADDVLAEGGAVCGAALSGQAFKVSHAFAATADALSPLRLSKYQQSEVGDAYAGVRERLKAGQRVLFTGTPCQVAGLIRLLELWHVDTRNLVTAEVLCHGVTSAKVAAAYAKSMTSKQHGPVGHMDYRVKCRPWYSGSSSMRLTYADGHTQVLDRLIDPFYLAYNRNLILRPCCYHCPFTRIEGRLADFTIGDFWGAEDYIRDRDALRRGISLVLVNTDKGIGIWNRLTQSGKVCARELDVAKAIPRNGALVRPAKPHPGRAKLFAGLESEDFSALIDRIFPGARRKNRLKVLVGYDNMKRVNRLKRFLRGKKP